MKRQRTQERKMKFDIILPTIARPSVTAAICSVIMQTYEDWNLWVIADQVRLSEWPDDDRIIVYEIVDLPNTPDYGARARNYGIRQGEREWIAYIDDDDEWLPNHLEVIASMAEGHNMVRTAGQSFMMKHRHPRTSKLVRKMGPVNDTDILTVGMAHTRELFDKTSGWLPEDNHDHKLWKEMLDAGGQPVVSKQVTFHFAR